MVPSSPSDRVRRHWFGDARDDGRRMEVSWHPRDRLIIVSLWHGDVCRATFRLPAEGAERLVGLLGDALDDEAGRSTAAGGASAERRPTGTAGAERGARRGPSNPRSSPGAGIVELGPRLG